MNEDDLQRILKKCRPEDGYKSVMEYFTVLIDEMTLEELAQVRPLLVRRYPNHPTFSDVVALIDVEIALRKLDCAD